MKKITTHEDCANLQNYLDKIYKWSKEWKMEFNVKKCHILDIVKSEISPQDYELGDKLLFKERKEKDF